MLQLELLEMRQFIKDELRSDKDSRYAHTPDKMQTSGIQKSS